MARATVIIPTFGNAKFARWAVKSVQRQTVTDIEICIICDGSPENMVSFFNNMRKEDPRIKVFVFPKVAPDRGTLSRYRNQTNHRENYLLLQPR